MGYSFEKWSLYKSDVKLHNGIINTFYFFTRWKPKRGTPCNLPEGYLVSVNERTGLPFLEIVDEISNQN